MCGIAGVVRFDREPVRVSDIRRMTDAIAHRGPDGEEQWIEGPVGLGHRRLAIIDLSPSASQPMESRDGRYVLSYNGEIYNFRQLRDMMIQEGVPFRTNSDTEVVLNALVHWGHEALKMFNGMFALALWDRSRECMMLARDRVGIKPLYVQVLPDRVAFASEQKAITALGGPQVRLDLKALREYMTFQNIFTDRTFIEGVALLPPGHFATVSVGDGGPQLQRTQYWDFAFREPKGDVDPREYAEELDRLLQQAVDRTLISDVEVGAYLSGGMDSGSISALASRRIPGIKTFTGGFDLTSASGLELAFDERAKAEAMSAAFKTEHYEIVMKSGDMERCMPHLIWHLEEPRVGQSYPNFYAAKLASRFVKVVLSGAGGDELFGGYPWRYFGQSNATTFESFTEDYFAYWQRLVDDTTLQKLLSPVWDHTAGVSADRIFAGVFPEGCSEARTPADFVNLALHFEAKTFLHGLLIVEDKLSMAHGLETRLPFLDNDLIDFAMSCPVSLKVRNPRSQLRLDENTIGNKNHIYFQQTSDGKLILREVMSKYVPPEVTERPKQGFSAPDASWFRGESIEYVRRSLLDPAARINDVLDRGTVVSLVDEHLTGQHNRRLLLWSLLSLEQWLQTSW